MTADPAGWPDDVREAVARALRKRSTGLEVAKWQSWLPEADAALEATRPFVAASVAAAVEGMREACAKWHDAQEASWQAVQDKDDHAHYMIHQHAGYARALRCFDPSLFGFPIPSADALARRDAEMRREGMVDAAEIAQSYGDRVVIDPAKRHDPLTKQLSAQKVMARDIEAAIRARAVGEERQG